MLNSEPMPANVGRFLSAIARDLAGVPPAMTASLSKQPPSGNMMTDEGWPRRVRWSFSTRLRDDKRDRPEDRGDARRKDVIARIPTTFRRSLMISFLMDQPDDGNDIRLPKIEGSSPFLAAESPGGL